MQFSEKEQKDFAVNLGISFTYLGAVLSDSGKFSQSVSAYDQAITILEPLYEKEQLVEHANTLASAYMSKSTVLLTPHLLLNETTTKNPDKIIEKLNNKRREALKENNKAIAIYESLVNVQRQQEYAASLAMIYIINGNILLELEEFNLAIAKYDDAIKILEQLIEDHQIKKLLEQLAGVYMNKGLAVKQYNKKKNTTHQDPFEALWQAHQIYDDLIDWDAEDLTIKLVSKYAWVCFHLGEYFETLFELTYSSHDIDAAFRMYGDARDGLYLCVKEGHHEFIPKLMKIFERHINFSNDTDEWSLIAEDTILVSDVLRTLLNSECSEHLKQEAMIHFKDICNFFKDLSKDKFQGICTAGGDNCKLVRDIIQDWLNLGL